MFGQIKDIFRRKRIRKFASTVPTGFIPLSDTVSVNVVIDAEEPGFDELKEKVLSWGRKNGLKLCIYFFDFRKISKEELLLTSIDTTILRKELDWLGTPEISKVKSLLGEKSDIFISLIDNGDHPIDFLSKCTKARFKIGRYGYEGHAFDMVISGSEEQEHPDSKEIFAAMTGFMEKIKG